MTTEAENLNKPQKPQLNIGAVISRFSPIIKFLIGGMIINGMFYLVVIDWIKAEWVLGVSVVLLPFAIFKLKTMEFDTVSNVTKKLKELQKEAKKLQM